MQFEAKGLIKKDKKFVLTYEITLTPEESETYQDIINLCHDYELSNPENWELCEFMSDLGWSWSNNILIFSDPNMFHTTLSELKRFIYKELDS